MNHILQLLFVIISIHSVRCHVVRKKDNIVQVDNTNIDDIKIEPVNPHPAVPTPVRKARQIQANAEFILNAANNYNLGPDAARRGIPSPYIGPIGGSTTRTPQISTTTARGYNGRTTPSVTTPRNRPGGNNAGGNNGGSSNAGGNNGGGNNNAGGSNAGWGNNNGGSNTAGGNNGGGNNNAGGSNGGWGNNNGGSNNSGGNNNAGGTGNYSNGELDEIFGYSDNGGSVISSASTQATWSTQSYEPQRPDGGWHHGHGHGRHGHGQGGRDDYGRW